MNRSSGRGDFGDDTGSAGDFGNDTGSAGLNIGFVVGGFVPSRVWNTTENCEVVPLPPAAGSVTSRMASSESVRWSRASNARGIEIGLADR